MARVIDVAHYIVQSCGSMTTFKLQKLLYYCQGWHLAWEGETLFNAEIEAWANGPVVREIYNLHRGEYRVNPPWPSMNADSERLQQGERESVDVVLDTYRDWTGRQLSRATHEERPWIEARQDLSPGQRGFAVIDTDVMQEFFDGIYNEL